MIRAAQDRRHEYQWIEEVAARGRSPVAKLQRIGGTSATESCRWPDNSPSATLDVSVGFHGLRQSFAGPRAAVSYAAINYRYRTTAPIQDILRDSARAIQFMRSKASEWNIDKARVAAYGGSAGAGTSLWLGFHDDLADPQSVDPVLRESSRLAVLGANACQCTYDIVRWKEILGDGPADNRTNAPGAFYGLKEGEDLESPRAKQIRADVDMLGLLSRDDPPVYLYSSLPNTPPTDRNHYVHHPKHAIAIKEKCDQLGVESVLILNDTPLPTGKNRDDVMLAFFFKHLSVAKAK